jgi:hypothetical protein
MELESFTFAPRMSPGPAATHNRTLAPGGMRGLVRSDLSAKAPKNKEDGKQKRKGGI